MFLSQNSYYSAQNLWMTNNQFQLNLGIGNSWNISAKPSVMYITNDALDNLWQGGGTLGFSWAGAFRPGDPMRYHSFQIGTGYMYYNSEGVG